MLPYFTYHPPEYGPMLTCAIVWFQFSGVLKNCTCRGGINGYLDFENAAFYKAHFGVTKWWSAAAGVAAIPVGLCFFAAVVLIRVFDTGSM